MHLAQFNVARPKFALDDPRLHEFMGNLARINTLGKTAPGFVWILEDSSDGGDSGAEGDSPPALYNLTVWESIESLHAFTYRSEHVDFVRRRHEWFETVTPYLVLWWVPAGHIPSLAEAKERLEHLNVHGPTPHAFHFRQTFPPQE